MPNAMFAYQWMFSNRSRKGRAFHHGSLSGVVQEMVGAMASKTTGELHHHRLRHDDPRRHRRKISCEESHTHEF